MQNELTIHGCIGRLANGLLAGGFALLLFLNQSCSKDNPTPAPIITPGDVYLAGDFRTVDQDNIASYWKNGERVSLSLEDGTNVIAITVSEGDVYAVGFDLNNGKLVPAYWKNGVAVPLGTTNFYPNTIAVANGKVYITGDSYNGTTGKNSIKLWKDGVLTSITDGTRSGYATALTVLNGNVYVAGNEYNASGTEYIPKYWKNGVSVPLTNGTTSANALSIAVVGNDVYVAGTENENGISVAKYWKNGAQVKLPGIGISQASSIAVSKGNVYAAGYEVNNSVRMAKYWKNGVEVPLSDNPGSTNGGTEAFSIAVHDEDIYVMGKILSTVNTALDRGVVWKNGTILYDLSSARVNSMFVY